MTTRDEVRCPLCAELILRKARKCKYCREWIAGPAPDTPGMSAVHATKPPSVDATSAEAQKPAGRAQLIVVYAAALLAIVFFLHRAFSGSEPSDEASGNSFRGPATESEKRYCAREASGQLNYSPEEIRMWANESPDIAVRYSACLINTRRLLNSQR